MTSTTTAVRDSLTMLRRNLRRARRYPIGVMTSIAMPLVLLLLFVYVFGDTLGTGLEGATGNRDSYLDYVMPAILMIAVAGAATTVAIVVAMDVTKGIVDRFRTMAIAPGAILTGHVISATLETLAGMTVVVAVALLLGFSPTATTVEWLAAAGLLTLATIAVVWLAVAIGLRSDSVEAASNLPMPLMLLPFLGSGFVPTDTLPAGVRMFAEHQPFTPIMQTLRGLLLGSAIGTDWMPAIAWGVVAGVAGWWWSRRLFAREA